MIKCIIKELIKQMLELIKTFFILLVVITFITSYIYFIILVINEYSINL